VTKLSDLSHADLVAKANELSRKWWGVDYTGTIELVNRKWRRKNACYIYRLNGEPAQIIRMSKPTNDARTEEDVIKTLLHELVHWRLRTQGLPASDGDKEFVEEALRVGAPISGTKAAQFAAKKYGKDAV
jgi:hypothetical protein